MKRFILLALMLIVAVSASAQSVIPMIRPSPASMPKELGLDNQVPVQSDQNNGYLDISTPTITISNTVVTDVTSYLPAGAVGFSANIFDGDVIFGCSSDLATGAKYIGWKVASGSQYIHRGLAGSKHVFALAMAATSTATLTAWGKR